MIADFSPIRTDTDLALYSYRPIRTDTDLALYSYGPIRQTPTCSRIMRISSIVLPTAPSSTVTVVSRISPYQQISLITS